MLISWHGLFTRRTAGDYRRYGYAEAAMSRKVRARQNGQQHGPSDKSQLASEIANRLDVIAAQLSSLGNDIAELRIPQSKARRIVTVLINICTVFVSLLGVLGVFLTVYQVRPVPIPQSGTSTDSKGFANVFSILNSGQLAMDDVNAVCDYRQIVFDGKNTLVTGDSYLVSMYRVPECPAWGTLPSNMP